jgi:hypothetical protein
LAAAGSAFAQTAKPETYREPAREVPVGGRADVIVCGAGPAGVSAAISAARAGADTLLIEAHGCLGGVWTAGMLSNIIPRNRPTGLLPELVANLQERGAQIDASRYDVEQMKLVLERMCRKAGVRVLLHTRVVAAAKQGARLSMAVTEGPSGRQAWPAKTFVDASGDGTLGALAGCRFDVGHPATGATQPMSLMALIVGVHYGELNRAGFVRGDGASSYAKGVDLRDAKKGLFQELRRAGWDPSYGEPTLFPIRADLMALMANHEYGKSAMSARDLTEATLHAREEINGMIDALRRRGGLWKNVRLVATAEQIGIREARRLRGRYTVTKEDLLRGARFDDAVCRSSSPVDIHALDPKAHRGYEDQGVKAKPYDIPMRALIAADVEGLLMAGRCISGDFFAHASYRVTGDAVPMGEAAGKVAAIAAKTNRPPHEVKWPLG